ncbi:MAG: sigma-70 family RNA polymerase sigma factor [Chlorobi bacterium]|nr:sigma-70 family RNA polymerase sigma factor [Chlorobiota bacterium]
MKPVIDLKPEELIKGCITGSRQAQNKFYNKYSPILYGICLRYAKNRTDADDILQESFIKIFKYLKDFRAEGSIEGWMRRIIVTTSFNFYKRKTLINHNIEPEHVTIPITGDNEVVSKMSHDELLDIINRLPNGYRMVFNLNTFDGYSHKEIGDRMNISVNTSKSQLSRAKASLQKKIITLFQSEEQKINLSMIPC